MHSPNSNLSSQDDFPELYALLEVNSEDAVVVSDIIVQLGFVIIFLLPLLIAPLRQKDA